MPVGNTWPDRCNHPTEFVAHDKRRVHGDVDLVMVYVDIGAADSGGFDFDLDLIRTRRWFRYLPNLHVPFASCIFH
jgi:hypothetical protein